MRSPTSQALALALALCGCGTWSNEDLRFLEALPTRDDLRVVVPVTPAASARAGGVAAVAACGLGAADNWLEARRTGDGINTSVDQLIGWVDAVRGFPPTSRLDDGRVWGPFDDDRHPGVRLRILISRSTLPDGTLEHAYRFEATRPAEASGRVYTILSGTFSGPSATHGRGGLVLDFDEIHAAGMQDAGTPLGQLEVGYDRTVDPRVVALRLAVDGAFGLVQEFQYDFRGFADGRGLFRYRFLKPAAGGTDALTVSASFAASGAGRGAITYQAASGASGEFQQCWDAGACLTFHQDLTGYSCGGATPCEAGAVSARPDVAPPLP